MSQDDETSPFDWERIEEEYCSGALTVAEICRMHGISRAQLLSTAAENNWRVDRTQVLRRAVNATIQGADPSLSVPLNDPESVHERAKDVSHAVRSAVELIGNHKNILGRARTVVMMLLDELEAATDGNDKLFDAILKLTAGGGRADDRARHQLLNALKTSERAASIRDLSTALKSLVAMERQAFGLSDTATPPDEPATKQDIENALGSLGKEQRDQLRRIAQSLAGAAQGTA